MLTGLCLAISVRLVTGFLAPLFQQHPRIAEAPSLVLADL